MVMLAIESARRAEESWDDETCEADIEEFWKQIIQAIRQVLVTSWPSLLGYLP